MLKSIEEKPQITCKMPVHRSTVSGMIALASFVVAGFAPGFAVAADGAKGAAVAQRWCATCHVVSSSQKSGNASVPTFADISAKRTIAQIKGALFVSHMRMPDMALIREEVDNVIVYIQTQAPPLDPWKPAPEKDKPKRPQQG